MASVRQNKIITITNDETYDLQTHLNRLADSANVVIPVATQAERDALTASAGMVVSRADRNNDLEIYTGSAWRSAVETGSVSTADSNWGYTGQLARLSGTDGKYTVTLAERMNRVGTAFAVSTTYLTYITAFVPSGWRPAAMFNGWALATDSADAPIFQTWFRITTAGDLQVRLDSGSSTFPVGGRIFFSGNWTTS